MVGWLASARPAVPRVGTRNRLSPSVPASLALTTSTSAAAPCQTRVLAPLST
ncbi:Uncharacterised protein [Bordetella pertussis]|nr:Uncharacterised protein [Bordetella pertussis]